MAASGCKYCDLESSREEENPRKATESKERQRKATESHEKQWKVLESNRKQWKWTKSSGLWIWLALSGGEQLGLRLYGIVFQQVLDMRLFEVNFGKIGPKHMTQSHKVVLMLARFLFHRQIQQIFLTKTFWIYFWRKKAQTNSKRAVLCDFELIYIPFTNLSTLYDHT